MKIVSHETLEKNRAELVIEIPEAEFEPALERAYRKNVGRMNVPGFRKGKAPRKMLEHMYGEGVFFEDAVNDSYHQAYLDAIAETGIDPVDHPDIEIMEIARTGYTFKAAVTTRPKVKLGQYKALHTVQPAIVVDENEIDEEIDRLRKRNSSVQTVERAAKQGDTIVFDFVGSIDGVPFEGGSAENFELKLGSGEFIPGFEEQLDGKTAGDDFDVNVSFPEDYHAPELAGKPAVFRCNLHEIKETLLPELDDEFAKDVSEFDTLTELRDSIREKIHHTRVHEAEHAVEDALLDQVIAGMEADIPEVMIEHQLEDMMRDLTYRLQSRMRIDLDTYLSMTGGSLDDLKAERRPAAERQVKAALAFDAIAEAEGLAVSDEELDTEYARLSESYGLDVDTIKKQINPEGLIHDIRSFKASRIVTDTAEIVNADGSPVVKHSCKPEPEETAEELEAKVTPESAESSVKEAGNADGQPDDTAKPASKPKKRSASK